MAFLTGTNAWKTKQKQIYWSIYSISQAISIFIIKPGGGDWAALSHFSVSVCFHSFPCSLREQTAGTSWSVDRCGAEYSDIYMAYTNQTAVSISSSSEAFSGVTHVTCWICNPLLLMFEESHVAPLCVLYLDLRIDNGIRQLLIHQQTPTRHFLTCE